MSGSNHSVFWEGVLCSLMPLIISAQGHFPLDIGNIWEYWELPDYYAWTTRAEKDTVMPNGHEYVFLKKMNTGLGLEAYLRQDSTQVYRYLPSLEDEELLFDFSKITGDTVSVYSRQYDTVVTTVLDHGIHDFWGRERRFWTFLQEFLPTTVYDMWEVTDSLGLTAVQGEPGDRYVLHGAMIGGRTYGVLAEVEVPKSHLPKEPFLYQNYPNPFNSYSIIKFGVPERQSILVRILDHLGRTVVTLVDGPVAAGPHEISWNGQDKTGLEVSSGIYICELRAENMTRTIKMIVLH